MRGIKTTLNAFLIFSSLLISVSEFTPALAAPTLPPQLSYKPMSIEDSSVAQGKTKELEAILENAMKDTSAWKSRVKYGFDKVCGNKKFKLQDAGGGAFVIIAEFYACK
jgi:hypothetical protein